MKGRRALELLSLMLIGCSTETSVGMTPTPPDPGGPGMLPMAPVDEPFSFPDGVAGEWTGYFQAFTLPSGSDAITLKMGQNASGANEIQLVVGAGTPPAPPTDGAAYWPSTTQMPPLVTAPLIEGVSFLGHLVRWDGRRLRFSVATYAPWQAWCALQTSYPLGSGFYSCVPGAFECNTPAAGPDRCLARDGSRATFSIAQAMQCLNCACDAAECIAVPTPNQPFDITFDTNNAGSGAGIGQTFRLMK